MQLGFLSFDPLFAVGEAVSAGANLYFHLRTDLTADRLSGPDISPVSAGLVHPHVTQGFYQGGLAGFVAPLNDCDAISKLHGTLGGAAVVPQGDPVNPHAVALTSR